MATTTPGTTTARTTEHAVESRAKLVGLRVGTNQMVKRSE
jgi:hypothetical protein